MKPCVKYIRKNKTGIVVGLSIFSLLLLITVGVWSSGLSGRVEDLVILLLLSTVTLGIAVSFSVQYAYDEKYLYTKILGMVVVKEKIGIEFWIRNDKIGRGKFMSSICVGTGQRRLWALPLQWLTQEDVKEFVRFIRDKHGANLDKLVRLFVDEGVDLVWR